MKALAENEQPSNEYLQKADEIISTIEAMDDTDASQEDMAAVAQLAAGTLAFDPNTTCDHHHEEGHTCGEHDHNCGGFCGK